LAVEHRHFRGFCLAVEHRHFRGFFPQKTQIPGVKKPTVGFFMREAVSNLQFETAS